MKNRKYFLIGIILCVVALASVSCGQGVMKGYQRVKYEESVKSWYLSFLERSIARGLVYRTYDVEKKAYVYKSKAISIDQINVKLQDWNDDLSEMGIKSYPDVKIKKEFVYIGDNSKGIEKDAFANKKYYDDFTYSNDKDVDYYTEIKDSKDDYNKPEASEKHYTKLIKVYNYVFVDVDENKKTKLDLCLDEYSNFSEIFKDFNDISYKFDVFQITESGKEEYKACKELYNAYVKTLKEERKKALEAYLKVEKVNDKNKKALIEDLKKLFAVREVKLTKEELKAKKDRAKESSK